jgi:hypothetical protein
VGEVMKVGLWNDSTHFPNLCSMKLSSYHKLLGDETELYDANHSYDVIYASKIFTESIEPDFGDTPVIRGGSGYDLNNKLPYAIEHIYPDYSLYPDFKAALGVLTRGCPRLKHAQSHGGFCITPDKDGCQTRKVADLSEFWRGQKEIILLDQNLLAAREREDLLQQLIDSRATITFDGGMDVRFMNDKLIEMCKKIKVRDWHFAWDDPAENLESNFKLIAESGLVGKDRCSVYVLTNFWSTLEQDLHRIYTLQKYGFVPYVMVYDKQKFVNDNGRWKVGAGYIFTPEQLRHFKTCQHLQRWCNNRALIKSIPDFNNYEPYKKWLEKGQPIPTGGGVECK